MKQFFVVAGGLIVVIGSLWVVGQLVPEPAATWLCVLAIIPTLIAGHRGHNMLIWWLFSLAVLPIAFVCALLAKDRSRQACPHCLERMKVGASVCPHCQRDVIAATA